MTLESWLQNVKLRRLFKHEKRIKKYIKADLKRLKAYKKALLRVQKQIKEEIQ